MDFNALARVRPVIIAGGKGVRLWPVSREQMPKPYVRTNGAADTLLQATLRRVARLGVSARTVVVCNREHDFLVDVQAQSAASNGVQLVLEPEGRNTAPAICAAALALNRQGSDDPMLVLPADHVIRDSEAFAEAVESAAELARRGSLVTFAIKPTFPATGYGYLKIGKPIDAARRQFAIEAFIEKPNAPLAITFMDDGNYAWNSGMFMFRPSVILKAFEDLQPAILEACRAALDGDVEANVVKLAREGFVRAPSISIDYAIMEKAENVATVVASFDWSDVGDWQAVWTISEHDASGNAIVGNADVVQSEGSLIQSEGPLLIGVGLNDMIAIATKDAVIVAPKTRAQDVKLVVERLRAAQRPEVMNGRKVERPWGAYEQLHVGPGFQVKELTVHPGAKLSLQRHKHRSEHWVCIAGEGFVVCDSRRTPIAVGESMFIPQGSIHRLENAGPDVLRVVETQIGSYTGEDDIERFEDIYGRV